MESKDVMDKAVDNLVDPHQQLTSEADRLAAQKKRSLWLALALFGFVILVGVTSALQLKENIKRNADTNTAPPGPAISQDTQP